MLTTESRLAVEGGEPVRKHPFGPWPSFTPDEVDTAAAVLRSGKVNYWTGQEGRSFESEYAASLGTEYAIAVANGTLALELALYALGIAPGDEVIVTSRSFIASASCVVARGAVPVFADVDNDSQNITAESIAGVLTQRTKAIIPVHLAGWPCDMDSIMELASAKGLKVVEDCAQAHGALYKGRQVGSFGHINAFSFCQDKILSTGGEGGLVATNDKELWDKAWSYKDHGKSFQAVYHKQHPPGYRFLHESFGTNWRLTEMQSALGRLLLRKLPEHLAVRRRNAGILAEHFSRIPGLRVPEPPASVNHAYYKFYAFIRPEHLRAGWHLHRIQEAIIAEGIPCFAGYREMYLENAFPSHWRPTSGMANVTELGRTSLVFLVHPTLGEADMLDTSRAVEKVMTAATSRGNQRGSVTETEFLVTRA
jgi:dTDP-4-amino-4,6-dideoxygalactose transaminase